MDDNNNNNTNTSSTRPTTNVDKSNDGDGVKAPKRGRQSSKKLAPPAEEMLVSPPQKKPAIDVNKEMEQQGEKRAIFQSPPAPVMPSFYNNYHNYAGHGFSHPYAYYGHPNWSPMLSAPPSSPATMMSPSPFQHKFGWFGPPPIPVATSTPLNPAYVCSTSSQSQLDASMMDVQKEAGELSVPVSGEAENEQSLMEEMWDTTAVGNTKMDMSNSWTSYSNSMEDQSTDKNGQTSSGSSSTADTQVPMLMPNMPITPKPQFGTPHPMLYPYPVGHPYQFSFPPYSTAHLPMPIYQENQVQPIIVKDIEQEHSEDAKDGNGSIYRNCLVCGDNNFACGKYAGLQVCTGCRLFFKKMVESGTDETATFRCSKGSGNCLINKETRNWCQFCRFQACLKAGMERQKVIELKAKRERNKEHDPSPSQNVHNQQAQAPSKNVYKHKHDYNKTLELLNKLCQTFKSFHLHRRNTEGPIKLDELKKTLCGFMASIFEDQKVEIGEEKCEALVEREFASFLVIRHVFLDDLPTLKEYCAWNWNKQKENDEPNDDNGEKEQMDLLMQKVNKFRCGLVAEFIQAEEQAVLSALALSYPKFVESDEIKKVHAQLMECLYAQTFARNPNKFNYKVKAYNAMKRNLEELLN